MKKLITTAAIIAIMTTTTMAKENKVEVCKSYANLAETIMEHRQTGTPVFEMMEMASKTKVKALAEHLIINAYDVHIFDTKKYQDKIIKQFKNDSFIKCMQQY